MRARLWVVVLAASALGTGALAGCASDESFSDRLAGRDRVHGDAEGVTVSGFASRVEALPLAVGHCARFGRSAQFDVRTDDGAYRFRCVT